MSFQAYLDNIKTKTGKTSDDFKKLAAKKGLLQEGVTAREIVAWLKKDFDLGHGHAMAIYTMLKGAKEKKEPVEKGIARHFTGAKSGWGSAFDSLLNKIRHFGDDVSVAPASSYLSILRGDKKVAIVQVAGSCMDVGIKLKGVRPTKRFEPGDLWNAMVTHRVRITNANQIDNELMDWLRSAYEQNGKSK